MARTSKGMSFAVNPVCLALAMVMAAGAAPAQGQGVQNGTGIAGLWQCEGGVRPIDTNSRLPAVYFQFRMMINPDGTVQAQGIMNEQSQFVAQGNWQLSQDGSFVIQGQMQDVLGVSPWLFGSMVTSANTMSTQAMDTVNIVANQCQRTQ